MVEINRFQSKTKQLEAMFGGTWRYHRGAREWFDGDSRVVRAVSMCDCDDTCPHLPAYWMYSSNETPKRVEFYSEGLL